MAYVIYTAKRSLVVGRTAGTTVTLMLPSLTRLTPSRETRVQRQESLAKKVETLYYAGKRAWSVELEPVPGDQSGQLLEFLESVEDGHSFTFDPYGTPDAPSSSALTVVHSESPYTSERVISIGAGGASDLFQYSFNVREL